MSYGKKENKLHYSRQLHYETENCNILFICLLIQDLSIKSKSRPKTQMQDLILNFADREKRREIFKKMKISTRN